MARILIVDDSPTQLFAIRRIVEKLGHETITAEDGVVGIGLAKTQRPDLILMDVVMPNLNGFQATRTLKRDSATRHIPVILVTTKDQDIDRMWGMRQGAKAYITKPFTETELTEIIKVVLEESPAVLLNTPPRPSAPIGAPPIPPPPQGVQPSMSPPAPSVPPTSPGYAPPAEKSTSEATASPSNPAQSSQPASAPASAYPSPAVSMPPLREEGGMPPSTTPTVSAPARSSPSFDPSSATIRPLPSIQDTAAVVSRRDDAAEAEAPVSESGSPNLDSPPTPPHMGHAQAEAGIVSQDPVVPSPMQEKAAAEQPPSASQQDVAPPSAQDARPTYPMSISSQASWPSVPVSIPEEDVAPTELPEEDIPVAPLPFASEENAPSAISSRIEEMAPEESPAENGAWEHSPPVDLLPASEDILSEIPEPSFNRDALDDDIDSMTWRPPVTPPPVPDDRLASSEEPSEPPAPEPAVDSSPWPRPVLPPLPEDVPLIEEEEPPEAAPPPPRPRGGILSRLPWRWNTSVPSAPAPPAWTLEPAAPEPQPKPKKDKKK